MVVAKYVFLSILAMVVGATVCCAISNQYTCKASATPLGDFEVKPS